VRLIKGIFLAFLLTALSGCITAPVTFHDQNMDFSAIQTVAVLPFANLSGQKGVEGRVRDVFMNMLIATGGVYVQPAGEVARGIARTQVVEATAPSVEEIQKLGEVLSADAVITGVLKEYGEVRSGTASANVISLSLQLIEVQSGKVVWVGNSTKGGITAQDRLLGGGGQPMNKITEEAVSELIRLLFLG